MGCDMNGKKIVKSKTWVPEKYIPRQLEKEVERQKMLFEEEVKTGNRANSNIWKDIAFDNNCLNIV